MKLKLFCNYALFIFSVIIISCSGSDKTEKNYSLYDFIFYDSTGTDTIAAGTLKLSTLKQKTSGFYKINRKAAEFPIQNDSSVCEGTYDSAKNSLWLNMNPKLADNNVFVTAVLLNNKLEGDWVYSTMKGIKDKGKFYAEKK